MLSPLLRARQISLNAEVRVSGHSFVRRARGPVGRRSGPCSGSGLVEPPSMCWRVASWGAQATHSARVIGQMQGQTQLGGVPWRLPARLPLAPQWCGVGWSSGRPLSLFLLHVDSQHSLSWGAGSSSRVHFPLFSRVGHEASPFLPLRHAIPPSNGQVSWPFSFLGRGSVTFAFSVVW